MPPVVRKPAASGGASSSAGAHRDDIGLQLAAAREGIGVQPVVVHEADERVGLELEHILAGVVGERERASASPVDVVGPHRVELREHLVSPDAVLGKAHGDSDSVRWRSGNAAARSASSKSSAWLVDAERRLEMRRRELVERGPHRLCGGVLRIAPVCEHRGDDRRHRRSPRPSRC